MPTDIERFIHAQNANNAYKTAHAEIKKGKKQSHWIWFIFPQLMYLGESAHSLTYGIQDSREACDYLLNLILCQRYHDMLTLVKAHLEAGTALEILMGTKGDAYKFCSSLTLFTGILKYLQTTDKTAPFEQLHTLCDQVWTLLKQQSYTKCQSTRHFLANDLPTLTKPVSVPITYNAAPHAQFFVSTERAVVSEAHSSNAPQPIINALDKYIEQREKEWSFHYNFLGIVALIYLIQDAITGTDHFLIKNKEIKISAAKKVKLIADSGQSNPELTVEEIMALQEGRLGNIINAYGDINQFLKNNTSNTPQII